MMNEQVHLGHKGEIDSPLVISVFANWKYQDKQSGHESHLLSDQIGTDQSFGRGTAASSITKVLEF
jgi:hypothetical protein